MRVVVVVVVERHALNMETILRMRNALSNTTCFTA